MKKITSLLIALMVFATLLCVNAFAEIEDLNTSCATIIHEKLLKATPVVDAKLDDAYTQSLSMKLHGPAEEFYTAGSATETTATGTVYALYDDNYIYVFYHVVDNTLIQAAPDYIASHSHPYFSDSVEVRVGDDLEDHFAPYNGSNDSHHLFYANAHGLRFNAYEDSLGEDAAKLQYATKIADDNKTYYVELAIPCQKPFKQGEIIEFEFQINDLQDDLDNMVAIGCTYPHNLVTFPVGGNADGSATVAPVEPEKPVEPVTPVEPVAPVEPEKPVETPEEPVETPEEPTETPEEPTETPEEPTETPEEPTETPEEPTETPEEPTETPEEPAETPEEPAETPEEPAETPEEPAETPEEPAEEGGISPIIWVIIAVVVVAVIVVIAVVAKKKK